MKEENSIIRRESAIVEALEESVASNADKVRDLKNQMETLKQQIQEKDDIIASL